MESENGTELASAIDFFVENLSAYAQEGTPTVQGLYDATDKLRGLLLTLGLEVPETLPMPA